MTPEELREKYQSIRYDIDALVGLDDIDWSQLRHAHGEASDFPALINAALSDNPRDREFAFTLLHETIWHQGTVYQATPHTVHFIAALAESNEVSHKMEFALLLASLAQGKGYFDRDEYDEQDWEMWRQILAKRGEKLDELIVEDKEWTSETHQEVLKHLPILYPYLENDDKYLRGYIMDALSRFPERGQEIIPLLDQALTSEKSELNRERIEHILSVFSKFED